MINKSNKHLRKKGVVTAISAVTEVEEKRWVDAQKSELEFAKKTILSKDDWNFWWAEKFEYYRAIEGRIFDSVLEVGCGPHTNIKNILPKIKCKKIFLEDPLIQFYVTCLVVKNKENS